MPDGRHDDEPGLRKQAVEIGSPVRTDELDIGQPEVVGPRPQRLFLRPVADDLQPHGRGESSRFEQHVDALLFDEPSEEQPVIAVAGLERELRAVERVPQPPPAKWADGQNASVSEAMNWLENRMCGRSRTRPIRSWA